MSRVKHKSVRFKRKQRSVRAEEERKRLVTQLAIDEYWQKIIAVAKDIAIDCNHASDKSFQYVILKVKSEFSNDEVKADMMGRLEGAPDELTDEQLDEILADARQNLVSLSAVESFAIQKGQMPTARRDSSGNIVVMRPNDGDAKYFRMKLRKERKHGN